MTKFSNNERNVLDAGSPTYPAVSSAGCAGRTAVDGGSWRTPPPCFSISELVSRPQLDIEEGLAALAEILAGVPDDEQARPAPDPDPGIAGANTARVYNFDVARLTVPA